VNKLVSLEGSQLPLVSL